MPRGWWRPVARESGLGGGKGGTGPLLRDRGRGEAARARSRGRAGARRPRGRGGGGAAPAPLSGAGRGGGGRAGAERGGGGAERAAGSAGGWRQRGHGRRRVHAAGAAPRGGGAAVPPHGARRGLVGHGRWRRLPGRRAAVRAAPGAAPGPPDHPLGPLHGLVAAQRAPAQEGLRLRHGQRTDMPDLPVRGGPRRRRGRRAPQHRRLPHEALRVHVPGLQVPAAALGSWGGGRGGPSGSRSESRRRGKPRLGGDGGSGPGTRGRGEGREERGPRRSAGAAGAAFPRWYPPPHACSCRFCFQ